MIMQFVPTQILILCAGKCQRGICSGERNPEF